MSNYLVARAHFKITVLCPVCSSAPMHLNNGISNRSSYEHKSSLNEEGSKSCCYGGTEEWMIGLTQRIPLWKTYKSKPIVTHTNLKFRRTALLSLLLKSEMYASSTGMHTFLYASSHWRNRGQFALHSKFAEYRMFLYTVFVACTKLLWKRRLTFALWSPWTSPYKFVSIFLISAPFPKVYGKLYHT